MYSDREPMLGKCAGAAHVVVHVQCLRAPVYPGCGIHICTLVRHGCVEWRLVSTQGRHKYNTCHSLFCAGKYKPSYKPRLRLGLYSVYISRTKQRLACIIYIYPLSIFFHIHRGFRLHCILIVTKNRVTCEKIKEKHNEKNHTRFIEV